MDIAIYTVHPLNLIIDILASLHMEMVVMELEVCMVLPMVEMDTLLVPPVMDVMVILIGMMVMIVAL